LNELRVNEEIEENLGVNDFRSKCESEINGVFIGVRSGCQKVKIILSI
jgi:hypothetical protein